MTASSQPRISLGSIIACDTLNDLMAQNMASSNPDQTLERISALFTFGRPLNKVFYFLRARTSPKTYVLDEIFYALHNFRLRNPPPAGVQRRRSRSIPGSSGLTHGVPWTSPAAGCSSTRPTRIKS